MTGGDETFQIIPAGTDEPAIRCLLCGHRSWYRWDIVHKYCGWCRLYHRAVADGRALCAGGGTHECAEWQTATGTCAVCGPLLPPV